MLKQCRSWHMSLAHSEKQQRIFKGREDFLKKGHLDTSTTSTAQNGSAGQIFGVFFFLLDTLKAAF